ncbi:methyltransferase type 11 [Clostridium botulinum]|nr:methyltransferase type 11 [Clostridium botulinum]
MVKSFATTLNEIFQISNLTIKINFLSIHIKPNDKKKKAPIL